MKTVANTVAQGQELAKGMLGIDIATLLQAFVESKGLATSTSSPAPENGAAAALASAAGPVGNGNGADADPTAE